MRLIDADELRKNVLKWMPSDPCGKEEKEFPFETDICASMVMEIDDAPTVQPEINCSEIPNNWIPCSKRLPEEGEVVLTQAKFKDDVKMAVSSRIDYNYWTTWGTRDINIIAWMPLPEPARLEND